ncbi:alpha-ketoacid dehydrogenase subunit beta [Actinokineospora cianjurensis]|uniref:Pyruvate dehydrogenase E1 component beta subunit n=1 Tax=Actinokineospora cianjurensis TaxID=585224 RepID=A0A421AX76_9PSEU|nr:transketolase C-terminal domain-containing protein [Actinokineospora cianjurensis]RLK54401.1 pyruvate dehydrogenase E1 component beta subunit [Actinokineospora cianjurensis]
MPKLSYLKALNRALGDEMDRDESVFVLGEDVNFALTNITAGFLKRYGPDRVVEVPLTEQGFTNFATGAAMAGRRPVIEFQIPFLLLLVFEQITNQANKFLMMSGGQRSVPVTYLMPAAGWRAGWGAQHSDQPYSLFAHMGVKTVLPATPTDAYGLLTTAIRDDDPVVFFGPLASLGVREIVEYADLAPIPLGSGRVHRAGTDVTVVALGHLVHEALAVAEELADEASVEVWDPRSVYPFDWTGLAESVARTGRLVVFDDSNRACGMGAEILATAAEEMRLVAPPKRVTRPDGAIVGAVPELDVAIQPTKAQLAEAVRAVLKSTGW